MAVCIIKTKVLSMGSYLKDQEQLSCIAPCESTLQTNKACAVGRENTEACSEGSLKLSSGYSCELLRKYPIDSLGS